MKKLSLIITILFIVSNSFSQTTKFWLTVDDQRELKEIESEYNLKNVKKALPDSKTADLQKVYEFEVIGDYSTLLKHINKSNELMQPEIIEAFTSLYDPNDYNLTFTHDYALDLINAKDAWNITKGSPLVKIGISDSNFDTLHEELAGTFSFISPNIYGTNYNHGTAVAVTAAGNTDNGVGKSAIGNKCDMMLYGMNYNHLLQATYAGARVLNISWASGCSFNSYYQSVINEVYNNGTVIVAAAGNGPTCGGPDNYVYPASFENVISVSSIGPNNNHERFLGNQSSTHQHNDSVDLVAPGYDVAVSIASNNYTTGNGTSFAAPYVSGTVGLMLSINPCLSPAEVEMILKATALSVDSQNSLYTGKLGQGRIDAHAAVQMAKDLIPIDFDVILNEASCTNGIPSVSVQLNNGNMSDYNLQWSDGSNSWFRNDLSAGNYNFTISSPSGCSINQELTFEPTGPYFDYPNSIFIEDENFTLVDSNNDGVINVRGSIVIGNNMNYEMNGLNVNFSDNADLPSNYPNSGIVVKRGSSLSIKYTNLNSVKACSNIWGGIELWSEENNQASVSVQNSTIENAKIAVSNISKNGYNNEIDEDGGQVSISNSTIINSKIGVNIIETIGQSVHQEILNSSFLNTASIMSPTYINLNGVEFVKIKGNAFNGNESVLASSRGTAIYALNSTINVMNTKPNIQDLTFDNTYNNMYIGLDAINTSKGYLELNIYNELFNGVEKCINIHGQYKGNIVLNEFNITTGSSQDIAYGIKTVGNNSMFISENEFNSTESVNNYGMITESNIAGKGRIKLNSFDGYFVNGINFIGENDYTEISCNVFNIIGLSDWNIRNNDQLGTINIAEELNVNQFSAADNVEVNLNSENNQPFNYSDAYEYLPYETSASITLNAIQVEINFSEFCYNLGTDNSVLEGSLSTDQLENEESLSVYPNPSNGLFKLNSANTNIKQIQVMTMEGKVIETINWGQQESIDLTTYSSGTYLLGFDLGGSVKTERVVIL